MSCDFIVTFSLPIRRQFRPEVRAHGHASGEDVEVELFVGGMSVVVGQRETEQQGVGTQHFLEVIDDWNGAARAAHDVQMPGTVRPVH